MKLRRFDADRLGLVERDEVLDVSAALELLPPASNHRSSAARFFPLRSRRMPKRSSPRMIGSTAISRSLHRSQPTTFA